MGIWNACLKDKDLYARIQAIRNNESKWPLFKKVYAEKLEKEFKEGTLTLERFQAFIQSAEMADSPLNRDFTKVFKAQALLASCESATLQVNWEAFFDLLFSVMQSYQDPVDLEDAKIIEQLFKKLSSYDFSGTQELGQSISHVHPLRQLQVIMKDDTLKNCFKTISNSNVPFLWSRFKAGYADSLAKYCLQGHLAAADYTISQK